MIMRQIRFRGKRANNGEWVYGDLLQTNEGSVCIGVHGQYIDDSMHFNDMYNETPYINEDSVGQFTGLTDCNGKEIYEGDIVRVTQIRPKYEPQKDRGVHIVKFSPWYGWNLGTDKVRYEVEARTKLGAIDKIEIIGNVFDNPDLIPNQQRYDKI